MRSKPFLTTWAIALLLQLACSSDRSGATAAGGSTTSGTTSSVGGSASGTSTGVNTTSSSVNTTSSSATTGAGGASTSSNSTSSTGSAGAAGSGDQLFEPEGLQITKLAGAGEEMTLTALTLREGAYGAELYLTVNNDGDISACDPAISVEFFDHSEQSIATWLGGMYSTNIYQRGDDPSTIISCIDPGTRAMAGSVELPDAIAVADVGYVVYRFTYFARDILPFDLIAVDSLRISQLQGVTTGTGSAFTGVLENGLELALANPTVTIFSLDGAGRPLSMATSTYEGEVAPNGTWPFQTTSVNYPGVEQAAFVSGSIAM